jgi:hypothetical protein
MTATAARALHRTGHGAGRPGLARGHAVLLAGRTEALRLCRNPLNLAGLVAALFLVWWNSRNLVPQWWVWDVQLCSIMLAFAGPVLVTSQLAASRVRRDRATALYDSYPTPASARVLAHLAGVAGPLVLAVVALAVSAAWLDGLGPVGAPRPAVLVQGVLLVALAGALGVVLGVVLPSGVTGFITVAVLGAVEFELINQSFAAALLPHGASWLLPWMQPFASPWLPGPVSAIPPAGHLYWLTALIVIIGLSAYWRFAPPRRLTPVTAAATALAVCAAGVAGWSGWTQTRLVPATVTDALTSQVTHPELAQRCQRRAGVAYCSYPGYGNDVARWQEVVSGMFALLPKRPAKTLVVRQVVDSYVNMTGTLIGYQSPERLAAAFAAIMAFRDSLGSNPRLVPGSASPPVYVNVNWDGPANAGRSQFALAEQVAWWLTGLPTTAPALTGDEKPSDANMSCLAVGQAREAIALWLAASATTRTRPVYAQTLTTTHAYTLGVDLVAGPAKGQARWVPAYGSLWPMPAGYFPPGGNMQATEQGAVLAIEMLALPASRVTTALAGHWPEWLSPHATDAQLADALGITLPPLVLTPSAVRSLRLPADFASAGLPATQAVPAQSPSAALADPGSFGGWPVRVCQ